MSLTNPAAPAVDPRRWKALAFVGLAQLMVVLDGTVVNIALPSAQHDLGFSDADRQWVVTAYALPFGALLLFGGRLADRLGRRRTFQVGVVGFALASALGGASANLGMLLGARALQGCFGAMLAPSALSLVTVMFTKPAERAKAFGIWGSISGSGAAVGLMLGGLLTQYLSWRWTMFVNVFIAVIAFTGSVITVREPDRHRDHGRLDFLGIFLVTGGLASLVYGLSRAESDGWSSRVTIGLLAAAGVALVLFVIVEAISKAPLLPLRVVWNRDRGGAYLSLALAIIGMFGAFLFLTYYLQIVRGMSPVRSGAAFLPMVAGMLIGATQISARLMTRVRPRYLMPPGFLLGSAGMLALTRITPDSDYRNWVLPGTIALGLGMGCAFMPAMNVATGGVSPRDAGVASAMVNTSQQVGGAVGTALLSTMALSATHTYAAEHAVAGASAQQAATAQTQAMVHGYITAFWWAACLLLAAAVVSFALISFRVGQPFAAATAAPVGTESVFQEAAADAVADAEPKEFVLPLHDAIPAAEPEPRPDRANGAFDRAPIGHQTHTPPPFNGDGILIRGRVRDRDGAPMAMAVITAVSPQGRQVGRARSGADGGYQLGVPRTGTYVLIVATDGREPEASTITVRDRGVSHDILLAERGRLSVTVRSTDGSRLGGATLMLTDTGGNLLTSRRTGEDGTHTFRDLPVGALTLAVNAVGHRPGAQAIAIDSHGTTRAEVELHPAVRLIGTVRAWSTDSPLADARVMLMDGAGNVVATADSDPEGSFAFADLDAGEYTLIASGYPPVASAVQVDGRRDSRYDVQLGFPE
ncbi:DHA2 family efflux MFS transporter permease subunit [Catenulispora sp. NL8]|uniref:DHA2 family efflux MFS transporter permease subunit n=1 Tax=Catenulispora pinistramenti TaxID=2705254 RepID=A0ABS5L051_9ACTN|nr:MFS transporter [Catenulispora pinistramenti]MBS2551612.1 DHA2 family efflux MFS transporter permease subunit [Catenulispora pinistramenti]